MQPARTEESLEELPEAEELPLVADESAVRKSPLAEDPRGLKTAAAVLAGVCVLLTAASGYKLAAKGATSGEPTGPVPEKNSAARPVVGVTEPAPAAAPKKRVSGGNLLLAARGAVASGCERPEVMIDGDSINYDGGQGYSSYDMNNNQQQGCVVTLPEPAELSRIRFLLWDKDPRVYTYQAFVSADGKTWKQIADKSKAPVSSWQDLRFELQPVKAVRIKGLTSSANQYFHIVEMEGYNEGKLAAQRQPPKSNRPASAVALKPGLWAEYFDGADSHATVEDRPTLARAESTVDFGSLPPPQQKGQGLQGWPLAGACAAVFTGFVKVDKESLYTFFLSSDDGSKLYVDGELVIDNDGLHGMTELWGQVDLAPGYHRIWLAYFNAGGPMGLDLQWKPKDDDRKPIPPESLFHDPSERAQP